MDHSIMQLAILDRRLLRRGRNNRRTNPQAKLTPFSIQKNQKNATSGPCTPHAAQGPVSFITFMNKALLQTFRDGKLSKKPALYSRTRVKPKAMWTMLRPISSSGEGTRHGG